MFNVPLEPTQSVTQVITQLKFLLLLTFHERDRILHGPDRGCVIVGGGRGALQVWLAALSLPDMSNLLLSDARSPQMQVAAYPPPPGPHQGICGGTTLRCFPHYPATLQGTPAI